MNLLSIIFQIAVLIFIGQPSLALIYERLASPVAQLERVQVVNTINGKSVRTADGKLLRGGAFFVFEYGRDTGQTGHIYDASHWRELKSKGINVVRLVFFDPWQRTHGDVGSHQPYPHADLNDSGDVAAMLQDFDHIVNTAKAHQMYVLINYHDAGGYRDPDYSQPADDDRRFPNLDTMNYLVRFWQIIAPRYANQNHVFYELVNEPVRWLPEHYTDEVLNDLKQIYDQVRAAAPKTHLVMLSFANHQSNDPEQHSMLRVARRMRFLGVDFSNASVSFHPYNLHPPKPNPSQPILDLMCEFPAINTEQNFPAGFIKGSEDPDATGLDGDLLGVQSMERLGISWFHWNIDTPQLFQENFVEKVIPDAIKKDYYWIDTNPGIDTSPSFAVPQPNSLHRIDR